MIDVLLTNSYFLRYDPKEYRAMMPYMPLGTLYAAQALREQGISVAVFDSMLATSEDDILPPLSQFSPKFLVVYDDDFNYLTKMCLRRMREAAFRLISIAKQHGCTVVVHSSDAADHIASYVAHGADYVIPGEGERTLIELIQSLRTPSPAAHSEIRGLAYRQNGSYARTISRSPLSNLDELSFPARDLIDIEQYKFLWKKHHGYFSMNIVTTRGCPFHCNWCAKPIYGQVYHSRSPHNVIEEMLLLKQQYRPDHLWFCDDIFGLKPGWIAEFADEVIKRNAEIPYKCLSRADLLLKDDTVSHLARGGCKTVWIGAESGSQKILDAMEKGTTIEQIYTSTRILKEHGIHVGFFLQYGYPGETKYDIEKTLAMVRDCQPDEIGISVSYPLPGTKFYDKVKKEMGEKHNWTDSQDLAMLFRGEYSPDFYRTLHRITHKRFRIWQSRTLLRKCVSNPSLIDRASLRRLALTPYYAVTLLPLEAKLRWLEKSGSEH